MIINIVYNLTENICSIMHSAIKRNSKLSFAIASLFTIAAAFLFCYFSRQGFRWMPFIGTSVFCILIYYSILNAQKNYRKAIFYAFLLSAAFQFYLAWQFIGVEHDINNQMNAATAIEEGKNIYTDVHSFYTKMPIHENIKPLFTKEDFKGKLIKGDYYAGPMWAYISFLMLKLSKLFSANFSTVVHFPMIIATLLIGSLLYKIMRHQKKSDKETYVTVALYLLNPVVLMVSGYHGQVDNLGIVFLVLYVYFLLKLEKTNLFHNFLLGLSLVVKVVTAPVMPFFIAKQKRFYKMVLFGITVSLPYIFLLFSYPNADLRTKLRIIIPYGGVKYLWSYSRIEQYLTTIFALPNLHELFNYIYIAITIAMFAAIFFYFLRRHDIGYVDGIILSNLFFFAFSSGFGVQYFLWVIPFFALKSDDSKFKFFYWVFIFLSTLMALLFYYGNANRYYFIRDAVSYSLIGITLWIFVVLWWIWYIKIGVSIKNKNLT